MILPVFAASAFFGVSNGLDGLVFIILATISFLTVLLVLSFKKGVNKKIWQLG